MEECVVKLFNITIFILTILCLNVDWFQPFKHTQYSVGTIYLTIQNLLRQERYKQENIILVGMTPGTKEPPLTIDSYLSPLINDSRSIKVVSLL